MKGNVIDLAVGVVIGAAFGRSSHRSWAIIIMPPLGLAVGGINFTDLAFRIGTDPDGRSRCCSSYGAFIQTILEFVIVAIALSLLMVKVDQPAEDGRDPAVPGSPTRRPSSRGARSCCSKFATCSRRKLERPTGDARAWRIGAAATSVAAARGSNSEVASAPGRTHRVSGSPHPVRVTARSSSMRPYRRYGLERSIRDQSMMTPPHPESACASRAAAR